MGLRLSIFSDGFVSSKTNVKQKEVTLMSVDGPDEPTEDAPEIVVVEREIYGKPYKHVELKDGERTAFGGRFVWCCDSRFRSVHPYPIPLHDHVL